MKKLIVSCDGTWNTPDEKQGDIPAPTNVVRLHNTIADVDDAGIKQVKYYHPGVGTDGTFFEKLAGGAYGGGISQNILSAYRWLADHYESGDQIFLFGFSRGAFTARSLSGMIGACGLPDLAGLSPTDAWARIQSAYDTIYRIEKSKRPPITWAQVAGPDGTAIPIEFIGVWDTVGSLGVPDDFALLNLIDDPNKWKFHDTALGKNVKFARHAMAIDEMRASFTPTLWTEDGDEDIALNDGVRVKQIWFPGVHCDVGGGYANCGLSDIALDWMMTEAETAKLKLKAAYRVQVKPQYQELLHDSATGAFKLLRTRPRARPKLTQTSPDYHPASWTRDQAPPITQSPYHHPTLVLAPGQQSDPIEIYARNHWNETSIYLEENATYVFTAEGEWLDRDIPAGPDGPPKAQDFRIGELFQAAGTVLGKVEDLFKKIAGNKSADFIGTKRVEDEAWFALMGAIANDGPADEPNTNADGSPYPHQTFLIGRGPVSLTLKPKEAGYLFAFANDAWHFYENNRGSVTLRVKRVS